MEIKVGDWVYGTRNVDQNPSVIKVGYIFNICNNGSRCWAGEDEDYVNYMKNPTILHPLTDAEFESLKEGDRLAIINFARDSDNKANGTICEVKYINHQDTFHVDKVDVVDTDSEGVYYVRKHEVALLPPVEKSKPSVLTPSPCPHPEWLGNYKHYDGSIHNVIWKQENYLAEYMMEFNGCESKTFDVCLGPDWNPSSFKEWTKIDWTPPEKRRVNIGWDPYGLGD